MRDATVRDHLELLKTAARRSDVPPFMVMDVMAAAERIEAAGGHVIHMEVGQPAASAPKTAIAAAHRALDSGRIDYTSALGIPSLRERIARHYRDAYGCTVSPERIVVTTGSSGGFILAFLSMFEPGDRVAVTVPGYPPYRHILTALGCEPVLIETTSETRHALRRGLACGAPQDAAQGRAGRQSGQSDRHHDVAGSADRTDRGGRGRRYPLHFRRDLSRARLCLSGGDGGGAFAPCTRDQFLLQIFLHDRLAGRLDGGAGAAGAPHRTPAAKSRDLGAHPFAD